tara:strand:+ start:91 stop:462 length:372 start_codon:yes stop_codon:yes gene_type:complete
MKYNFATDVRDLTLDIINKLELNHIEIDQLHFIRSNGTKSRYVLARIHTLSKILQKSLNMKPNYVIEVISEKYDTYSDTEKEKIIIHELLHIPNSFKGGLLPHKNIITKKIINKLHKKYLEVK